MRVLFVLLRLLLSWLLLLRHLSQQSYKKRHIPENHFETEKKEGAGVAEHGQRRRVPLKRDADASGAYPAEVRGFKSHPPHHYVENGRGFRILILNEIFGLAEDFATVAVFTRHKFKA